MFFTFIKIIVITILSKNFKVSGRICCISRPFIVRAVHCYALCNMLWFAHRVTNCFIVSIYFIAIAPSQTIAIITLYHPNNYTSVSKYYAYLLFN